MPTETKTRIRICADCKKVPAKGIRSKRCLECHQKHLKEKTLRWNKKRSEEARKNWSPICEHPDCNEPKRNNLVATKWCEKHLRDMRIQYGREYRQRRREHKIANPGKCQNPGCTNDSFSYKAKYCSPCRAEVVKAQKAMYRVDRQVDHNLKNLQVIQHCRDQLNEVINEAIDAPDSLDTMRVHRLATVMLQIRAWNSR